jgi:putative hydrolase of the HAD superfamily
MIYTTLFFDLDDTLYPSNTGLWSAIRGRMSQYMLERLCLPPDQVPALRRYYFETYGTTLRGLQINYQIDPDDYLAYVHDLPLADYLRPCPPEARQLLLSLPQERWIFTNADANHARRVLDRIGLEGCFTGIIDICALGYLCKPDLPAYQRALQIAGDPDPGRCVLFDDKLTNLSTARWLNMATVLVCEDCLGDLDGNRCITDLMDLPVIMPELWGEHGYGD